MGAYDKIIKESLTASAQFILEKCLSVPASTKAEDLDVKLQSTIERAPDF